MQSRPETRRSDNCDQRKRAGRVKGAQRRSGPLTRLSAPGQSGTGATANQEAIAPGKLGATLAGTGAEAKQFWLFLPEGKLALTSVRILKQHPGAHKTRAPADPTLTYGRVRPRRTAPGPHLRCGGGVAHAPSLLRHLCWGAYRAAQTAALLARSDQHQHRLRQWIAAPP